MKQRSIATMIAVAVMTSTVIAANYNFPSSNPPGGKKPADVKQFATIIWDDNAYSGKSGTNYEGPTTQQFQFTSVNWINGVRSEGGWNTSKNKNELGIVEGEIGMSWAAHTLSGAKIYPYKKWVSTMGYIPKTQAGCDTVIYHDSIWSCEDWPISQGKQQITIKTSTGKDTTVSVDTYNPPRLLDTVSGVFTVKVHNGTAWVDTQLPWSQIQAYDKAAIREQYKAWKFIVPTETTLSRKNNDGSKVQFTFNVISGLFVPTYPVDWQSRESDLGYYVPKAEFYPVDYSPSLTHAKIAVSWGREMPIYEDKAKSKLFSDGYINYAFQEARDGGHEIGNHTIDHMESNSPLPVSYFEKWNNNKATNGFDYSALDTMPWGTVYDEAKEFGQRQGNNWQTMGWKMNAGKYIAKETWKGAIALSETVIDEHLGLSVAKKNLGAFRAPRLEVNSGLYFALSELGYQYDCGLEDGYEENVDGTNFLWPYTMDNGNPNATYQRSIGERVGIDSLPAGLWQIPSNVFIVPPTIRKAVYENHAKIDAAAGGESIESFEDWDAAGGKITGYDFNLYILWGMTKAQWLATMQHTTQLRLDGNKAPIHYGAHTDYYTPIYDYATLLNDQNKESYGLNVTNKWNTWKDRVTSMEEWVDWSIGKGVHFVTGKRLIEEIQAMQVGEKFGTPGKIDSPVWKFYGNATTGETSTKTEVSGDIVDASISIKGNTGTGYPDPRYALYEEAGYFEGLTHISLNYKTTSPLQLRLMTADGEWREVSLGSIKNSVNSGKIPVSAFQFNQYSGKKATGQINTAEIVGIEVKMVTTSTEPTTEMLTIKDLVLYGAKGTTPLSIGTAAVSAKTGIAIKNITNNSLSLNVPKAGNYSVSVVGLNGRVMSNISNTTLNSGINKLNLNNLSSGVYLVKVAGASGSVTMKSVVR